MKNIKLILIGISLLFSILANASECDSDRTYKKDFPFPKTFESAQILSKELCLIAISPNPNFKLSEPIAKVWRDAALDETKLLLQAGIDVEGHINTLYKDLLNGLPFSTFTVDKISMTYNVSDNDIFVITEEENKKCITLSYKASCYEVLEKLQIALNTSVSATNVVDLIKVSKTIGIYSKLWGRYFEESRSQMSYELLANTWLYRNELKRNEFVMPPKYQLILAHPSIVIEYVNDASDGERLKESLALEWFGINFWNTTIPFGISYVHTYSDRSSVREFGQGVMFHINNNYSIGVVDHDGEMGVFVTVDLLKSFETKQKRLVRFREKARKYF